MKRTVAGAPGDGSFPEELVVVRLRALHVPQLKAPTPGTQRVHPEDHLLFIHRTYEPHAFSKGDGRHPGRPPELPSGIERRQAESVVDDQVTPIEGHMSLEDVVQPDDGNGRVELARTFPPPPEGMPLFQLSREVEDARPQLVVEEQAVTCCVQPTVGPDPLLVAQTIRVGLAVRLGQPTRLSGRRSARHRRDLACRRCARARQRRGHRQRSRYRQTVHRDEAGKGTRVMRLAPFVGPATRGKHDTVACATRTSHVIHHRRRRWHAARAPSARQPHRAARRTDGMVTRRSASNVCCANSHMGSAECSDTTWRWMASAKGKGLWRHSGARSRCS